MDLSNGLIVAFGVNRSCSALTEASTCSSPEVLAVALDLAVAVSVAVSVAVLVPVAM